MNTHNLPKMLYSYTEGWQDLMRVHPSVSGMLASYVVPMSLIPPAMFLYSMLVTPGAVFPALVPQISAVEALTIAVVFFFIEIGMVLLMASIIQQMGDAVDVKPAYEDAFILAAVAPTPLWLSSLALFIPVTWLNALVVVVAWVASAALIYHGVEPLFRLENHSKARLMGSFVLMAGVIAWAALLVVLTLMLSMVIGLR
ncbi:MAG TPA: Yip1 family protein [Rhodocyclaceae bacterium]|nr:Yip1 family protein [Rhodocyclaceae bacterium]HRQ46361.1 Yip1 family protein [Rhodocyclaceae bacterium]